jgi:hypothetical protein
LRKWNIFINFTIINITVITDGNIAVITDGNIAGIPRWMRLKWVRIGSNEKLKNAGNKRSPESLGLRGSQSVMPAVYRSPALF